MFIESPAIQDEQSCRTLSSLQRTATTTKIYRKHLYADNYVIGSSFIKDIFFLLALQPLSGVVFYSPLAGFSLLAYEIS